MRNWFVFAASERWHEDDSDVDTFENAVALIRKQSELNEFRLLVDWTRARQPALLAWVAKRLLRALQLAGDWHRLLDVVGWLGDHPRPGFYLRQMDVPGVHSKFVEGHRGVRGELLDRALPPESISATIGSAGTSAWSRSASGTGEWRPRSGKPGRLE